MKSEQKNNFSPRDFLLLGVILCFALFFRLYKINAPLADFNSWKQADTAAIAQNFTERQFNIFQPEYADISGRNIGLHSFEFPMYSAFLGAIYKYFPLLSLEAYGRLLSIISSLCVIAIIYLLLQQEFSRLAAFSASLVYAVFPFFVFFSRVILPEPMAITFIFLGILFLYFFSKEKRRTFQWTFLSISSALFALGLLISPYTITYCIVAIAVFMKKYRWELLRKFSVYFFLIITFVPFFLWQMHISKNTNGGLLNYLLDSNVYTTPDNHRTFFHPSFFSVVLYERIATTVLGGLMTFFLILGIFSRTKRIFFAALLFSTLVFLFLFQSLNVRHVHFLLFILPVIAIYVGIGVDYLRRNYKTFLPVPLLIIIATLFFGLSFFVSYEKIKPYYSYSNDLISITNLIKDLTQKDDKIITDTNGDTTLLYISHRKGAASKYENLEALAKEGYVYFITQKADEITQLKKERVYQLVFENEKVAIFKL